MGKLRPELGKTGTAQHFKSTAGLGPGREMGSHGQGKSGGGLSELDLLILQSAQDGEGIEDMAREAKVHAATLGKEIALLQIRGYIGGDGSLTKKGLEALRAEDQG